MEFVTIVILGITLLTMGLVVWALLSINEKLEILVRIQLKKDDIHFSDRDMEEEVEKYRDK